MAAKKQNLIKEFSSITGADKDTAKHFLDACSNNLETAVTMFLDGKTDAGTASAPSKPQTDDDNVRAPIPQTSGVLVDGPFYTTSSRGRYNSRRHQRSAFDGFRDFKAETTRQEALLSNNPRRNQRLKRLEDLFRPPLELMHRGTMETAREAGKQLSKWLMINVQNVQEFSCQVLNRDVWSKPSIQRVIKEYFVFWQVYNDSGEGERFTTFYPVSSWPHVSILDPRTGERLAVWNQVNTNNFEGKVEEFLADHGKIGDEDEGPPSKKTKKDHTALDDTEDSQLAAAIAASLAESKSLPRHKVTIDNDDSDFIASNDCSDLSGFDGTSDEDLIVDSDTNTRSPKIVKEVPKSIDSNEIESLDATRVNEDYFSPGTDGMLTKSQNNSKCEQNGTFRHQNSEKNTANNERNSEKKWYKKVQSKLKVGTVENGKDMSHLTNNVYGGETSTKSPRPPPTTIPQKPVEEDMCRIMVRYPDGTREEIQMEIDTTVKDFSAELTRKGYPQQDYDVVTNFPRKSIFSVGMKKTLKQAGLYPRAAVFVEEKDCG